MLTEVPCRFALSRERSCGGEHDSAEERHTAGRSAALAVVGCVVAGVSVAAAAEPTRRPAGQGARPTPGTSRPSRSRPATRSPGTSTAATTSSTTSKATADRGRPELATLYVPPATRRRTASVHVHPARRLRVRLCRCTPGRCGGTVTVDGRPDDADRHTVHDAEHHAHDPRRPRPQPPPTPQPTTARHPDRRPHDPAPRRAARRRSTRPRRRSPSSSSRPSAAARRVALHALGDVRGHDPLQARQAHRAHGAAFRPRRLALGHGARAPGSSRRATPSRSRRVTRAATAPPSSARTCG